MDRKRWSVQQWLAIVLCGVTLALGSGAKATTSTLFGSIYSYSLTPDAFGSNAVLTVDQVTNVTDPPRVSGELNLELWAFPSPYQGLAVAGYRQNGFKLASYPLGRLAPGYVLRHVNSGPIAYEPPPPGTWYVTSLITEYDASDINAGGWLPRAFFNYVDPLVVTAGEVTPVAGLWWDPNQIGTGYSINVRHGVAVVLVWTYRPDGAAVWYIATGPLTGVGPRSMTAPLESYVGGPCIPCADVRVPVPVTGAGNIEITFTSPTAATVRLPGGRVAQIVPADF